MKITIGEWKTRGGDKANVVAENPNADGLSRFIGWVGNNPCCWGGDGRGATWFIRNDLIAPWSDPVPWDWSTTQPWCVCLVKSHYGDWFLSDADIDIGDDGWIFKGSSSMILPAKYAPKWSGDWKLSKTMRPGYKEVK